MWKDELKPNSHLRKLFDSLPTNSFVDLSRLYSFNIKHLAALYMLRPTLSQIDLTFKKVGDLPFAQLELVFCGNIAMGYILISQKYDSTIGRNYVRISRSSHKEDLNRLFVDNKMVILGNDSTIIATVMPQYWI